MKTMVIAMIVLLGAQVYAAPAKITKPATIEQSRAYVEENLKSYRDAAVSGKLKPAASQKVIEFFSESLQSNLSVNATGLELFTSKRPEALPKVIELISLTKSGTEAEQQKAGQNLKLLSIASKYIGTKETNANFKTDIETLEKIVDMADFNQAAKDFKVELAKTFNSDLTGKITLSDAISTASKGKITKEQIHSCI